MKTHTIMTAVGQALINGAIKAIETGSQSKLVQDVADAAAKNKHAIKRADWNAHLSLGTYKKLKAEGVMA